MEIDNITASNFDDNEPKIKIEHNDNRNHNDNNDGNKSKNNISSNKSNKIFPNKRKFHELENVNVNLKEEKKNNNNNNEKINVKKENENELESKVPPSKYYKLNRDTKNVQCPFLDQINRKSLDFDFEKICSVSMCNHNVYGCLVCGAYFAGRAKSSPAYFHALQENHRIFIHLDNGKIYCLPDDYEVIDPSLQDIKHNLHPKFTVDEIKLLDTRVEYSHALNERDYLPGVIGLNNLNHTDWLNVNIQSLMRVKPLRDYFIIEENYANCQSVLVKRFGELVRKYFNPRNFKGQVSPHELLQTISIESKKQFQIGKVSDPLAFLSFFLNTLHRDLGGNKKHHSSIISKTFQGLVAVTTQTPINMYKQNNSVDILDQEQILVKENKGGTKETYVVTEEKIPFFFILLDLPTMPLFKDSQKEKFIPQIPLPELLNKFNDTKEEYLPSGIIKRYRFVRLPSYLIIAFRRFAENNFFVEKNSTIVNFVVKNLDLKQYFFPMECDRQHLMNQTSSQLKEILKKNSENIENIIEKEELVNIIIDLYENKLQFKTKYDLVANICHEGDYHSGTSKAFIYHSANNFWYEMQDLHVQERLTQLVAVSEAYIQFWKRKD